jgi:chromosome partitioning protein
MDERINRVIGVLNYKGGTGKTTTVVNLASGLALRGARVLCVDLDPQGSLAAHLGIKYNDSLTDMLLGDAEPSACIYPARKNFDILPSDRSLLKAEKELWGMDNLRIARRVLSDKLRNVDDSYGFVIVDFPPSVTLLSQNGLLYITELLIPMMMSHLSVLGTQQVAGTLKAISRIPDHQVKLLGILPTIYNGRLRKDRDILKTIQQRFGDKVVEPIRNNVKLAEAPAHQKTIFEYAPRSNGAEDYVKFIRYVIRANATMPIPTPEVQRRPD